MRFVLDFINQTRYLVIFFNFLSTKSIVGVQILYNAQSQNACLGLSFSLFGKALLQMWLFAS
ncbi:MAG: hypothetical protein CO158_03900 [Piscirickettsiaceae bacterium CG_4_9_14_3_um_filter_43_564]|nr:MAG: hypothetical protein COW74_06065 [Piscirickettsiaceae bacterium CG18_big_fil_WC_8_21_14_2_50_44_103]PIU38429.1 MAG: hypothetical protein COT01_06525 [Piscirickettsiaceae bacterium CG07_land_8_20_14_0_80_44_28]PIW58324.1 MAG: hypothetical protein COW14_01630 [Piscirickettsiaceae bacterium CG12_big_fil_rev_8_21_14_0_65_44_934]PIW78587.1 MAG: hypothetical protein CO000_01040 [Piscirickettsiaceae bacterium CG_4_8_14_3_um_filter_44_38]PIX80825.1 MAG: hypothetical protein COZ36_00940 [Pisciri